jgi:hypothetical protein
MKKLTPILITGLALSALTGQAASVFQSNPGDLILDVSKSGFSDLEVDLGSLSSLTSQAQADGGTVQLNAYNVSSQLLGNFGSVNGLSFTVIGSQFDPGTTPDNVAWVTQKQAGSSPNTPPSNLSPSNTKTLAGNILAIQNDIVTWSGLNPADPVGNTANVALVPSSSSQSTEFIDSYTHNAANITGLIHNSANTTPASFTSGSIVSDLFQYTQTGIANSSTYEGLFTFNSNGTLDFTTAFTAVPEAGAYGVLAAGGLLLVTLRGQLRRSQA